MLDVPSFVVLAGGGVWLVICCVLLELMCCGDDGAEQVIPFPLIVFAGKLFETPPDAVMFKLACAIAQSSSEIDPHATDA